MEDKELNRLEKMLAGIREVCSNYHENLSIGTVIRSIESRINYYKKQKRNET